ncbi:PstS family phosphate ABC transporter substrate-binding protein [Caldibacillus sp. 210928-DFI.2.22]|uniref:PstS family phosphate ABC transporter substrate-binding protein n=1 Tax=unclassified Caldibacillus TaxID=2641266 RepID=UPI001D091487|nr:MULTISPECIES: PstS family phosphate ABC transporter substrate-binding protein [unclassified Caldibacillus]MCB7071072.1 PstS family phosphate ABC transporter substrate-binding protein [Caldibacillus sp. 210928-DFI.2.22]MCB7073569.1 PstS family phosphate ABC transporter substrate-binding protein [Caldibacillus sp. 210928-DFI.2.18]
MKNYKKLALSALISGAVLLTACGPQEGTSENESGSNGNKASEQSDQQLKGTVAVDGSSTVFPIMEAVVEEYNMNQPNVKVSVGMSGTGGGFEAFAAGETDISNASRPIKDEEKAALEKAGIEYTEFEIAYDGLSVVVNKDNDWVDYLTVDELKKMWIEDGTVKKWSDIRDGWPEEEIKFYSPGTDSGTFDYFDEVVLDGQPIVEKATLSEDDNTLVTGVTGDKNAIGYFGYAYYAENKDQLKVVPIDNGNGAVEPTNETVESGKYTPLSRPLFIYVKNESLSKPEVYDFVKFALENAGPLSEEVGYVSLPKEKYDKALSTLEDLK